MIDAESPGPALKPRDRLAGSSLFLRLPESSDAAFAAIWRPSQFPAPEKLVSDRLRDEPSFPSRSFRMMICRVPDARLLGSLRIRVEGGHFARIEPHADPLLAEDDRAAIVGEACGIVVSWLFERASLMSVAVHLPGLHPIVEEQFSQWPGRLAYRLRDHHLVNGVRTDGVVWQLFNQAWIDRLGEPPSADPAFSERLPVRRSVADLRGSHPRHPEALASGSRVHLRPFKAGEGAHAARTSMEEPEIYRPHGRTIRFTHNYEAFHTRVARNDPPHWIRFAIAERETNRSIGAIGLDMISWVHRHATSEVEYFEAEDRGKGFGTESGALMIEYGFRTLGMHTINAYVSDVNQRSVNATRKRGFRLAGYLAWRTISSSGMSGYYVFDMLQSEWLAADPPGGHASHDGA